MKTLESHMLDIEWDSFGIKVIKHFDESGNEVEPIDKKFEDLNSLLLQFSPKYLEKFHNKLNDKLLQSLGSLEDRFSRF